MHLWGCAMSRRGKAGYICTLHRDACALARSVDDIHVHVNVQLVRAQPRKLMVVGSSPTRGSYFFLEKKLLWASCVVLPYLVFLSISWMIKVMYKQTQ